MEESLNVMKIIAGAGLTLGGSALNVRSQETLAQQVEEKNV